MSTTFTQKIIDGYATIRWAVGDKVFHAAVYGDVLEVYSVSEKLERLK